LSLLSTNNGAVMAYRKGSGNKKNFIQGVKKTMKKKGTTGAFAKQAKRAKMGTAAYAEKVLKPGSKATAKTKKRATLAKTFAKLRRKKNAK